MKASSIYKRNLIRIMNTQGIYGTTSIVLSAINSMKEATDISLQGTQYFIQYLYFVQPSLLSHIEVEPTTTGVGYFEKAY